MSDSSDKDSKTEDATEKKIQDTIEKGKLPSSREAPILASFVAILLFAVFFGRDSVVQLGMFLSMFLEKPESWPLGTERDVVELYEVVLVQVVRAVSAMMILLVTAGIAASVLQNTPSVVFERIRPQASRLSLTKGWSRLFGKQGFAEFFKSVCKLGFVLAVLAFAVGEARFRLLSGMITNPVAFGEVIREVIVQILVSITVVMTVIAIADLFWSRFQWLEDLKMTKQEVKDELKQSDGDPIIKARMRSLARDRARKRMIGAVPRATLVIANPTHFAIALRYDRDEDAAPVVIAKGQDLIALKIREIAEANGIPVFEDVALARSMYKQVSIDSVIPAQFFQAVAELVRIVYANKATSSPRRETT
ncbi:flagellar biosynthesis protein FlhB [Mesorhizobium sp. NBSH29]|uniref:flagellar biosynthesis protein FlhB n=1 Tax=Mesorhizobium sp. NBSH29 TaxID=2654249 RepID=UPI0018968A14|nr:flagellar biosynthesis protein FlhB [Mesorhizobium sp. NBSH29]QPC85376.1 flagellar biosynthesis protein FlhB [Mesorhizobium sp. NBSH29]